MAELRKRGPAFRGSIAVTIGDGMIHHQFSVEITAEIFEYFLVNGPIDPIAIAHTQGLQAGKSARTTPLDCPWPTEYYEASLAWFAGYSVGNLVNTVKSVTSSSTS